MLDEITDEPIGAATGFTLGTKLKRMVALEFENVRDTMLGPLLGTPWMVS